MELVDSIMLEQRGITRLDIVTLRITIHAILIAWVELPKGLERICRCGGRIKGWSGTANRGSLIVTAVMRSNGWRLYKGVAVAIKGI